MMGKFRKLVPTEHQTCCTHEMHLVIQEVLYEKPSQKIKDTTFEETSDEIKSAMTNLNLTPKSGFLMPPRMKIFQSKTESALAICHHNCQKNCQVILKIPSEK